MTVTKLDSVYQLCLFQYSPNAENENQSETSQVTPASILGVSPPDTALPELLPGPLAEQQCIDFTFADGQLTDDATAPFNCDVALFADISNADQSVSDPIQAYEQRVFHLEQALDQALSYLTELGAQVKDQYLLEEKLASTEDYAFVQYQAIARLQEQISQHKEKLSQTYQTIANLEADNTATQTKLLVIQQDRLALRQENAQWKHACQELQQECDRQHRKITALEQENTAMQEQILQQVRQSNEYETAVQYWKDQFTANQEQLQKLLESIDLKLTDYEQSRNLNLAELRQIMQAIDLSPPSDHKDDPDVPSAPSSSLLNAFTIPDFLIRRYQNRSKIRTNRSQTDNLS